MNIREKLKITKKKDIEDYQSNLKLHYEAMQNELNTIIRNTITRQMTTLRTLMWVNVVFLFLSSRMFENTFFYFLLLFTIGIAFAMSFYSMLFGRQILYGNSQRRGMMRDIKDGDWAKTEGLYSMMYIVQRAIRYNGMIVIKRTKYITRITLITSFSLILLSICFIESSTYSKKESSWQQKSQQFQQDREVVEVVEEQDLMDQ